MKMFQEVGYYWSLAEYCEHVPILHRCGGCLNHKLLGCDTMIECGTASHTARMLLNGHRNAC